MKASCCISVQVFSHRNEFCSVSGAIRYGCSLSPPCNVSDVNVMDMWQSAVGDHTDAKHVLRHKDCTTCLQPQCANSSVTLTQLHLANVRRN